ncbi:MAG: hypothetical protein ACYTG5_20510 [Planctomycetota bacterium]|jgi:hypothetical protein
MLPAVPEITSRPLPERDRDVAANGSLFLDFHVHFHRQFDERDFLAGARSHYLAVRRQLALPGRFLGVLAFVDLAGQDSLEHLGNWIAESESDWTVLSTAEPVALIVADEVQGVEFVLLAGRQIGTAEGLEVLAVGSREVQEDGRPILDTLDSVRATDAVTILPWGFGKWWLRRGRVVEDVLMSAAPEILFLGDSGGRLRYGGTPRAFRLAADRGIRILPGSDPLPLPGHAGRAGSYGAVIEGDLDRDRPAAALKRILAENRAQPRIHGVLRALWPFVGDQVAMQVRKKMSRRR